MWRCVLLLGLVACVRANVVHCTDGIDCPTDKLCSPHGCVLPSQLEACVDPPPSNACTLADDEPGSCVDGICLPQCGDGVRQGGEDCDGADFGGTTCASFGYYSAAGLACRGNCSFDLAGCNERCGDGIVNGPETCDTVVPAGKDCTAFGAYAAPGLACNATCAFDTSMCAPLSCPTGYASIGVGTSSYRIESTSAKWADAEMACEAEGTHLAVVDTLAEQLGILNVTSTSHWVGATDRRLENTFVNVTDAPFVFYPWAPNEPSSPNEDCIEEHSDGQWNDVNCTSMRDFLCECDGRAANPDNY